MAANASKPRPERRMRYDPRPWAMSKDEALAMHREDAKRLRTEVRHHTIQFLAIRRAVRSAKADGFMSSALSWNPFRLRRALREVEEALNAEVKHDG